MKTFFNFTFPGLLFVCFFLFFTCQKKEPLSPQTSEIISVTNNEDINSDEVWKSNEIHIISRVISINNAILKIESGTTVKFEENAGIMVNDGAGLIADGSDSTIHFTCDTQQKGFWKYILFTKNCLADSNKLINCLIEYGGGDKNHPGTVICDNTSPVINFCTITQNLHSGVVLQGNCRGIEFLNNSITYSETAPIQTSATNVSFIGINTFIENQTNYLDIIDNEVTNNDTWYKQSIPFRLTVGLKITNSTLKITDGVRLNFEQNQLLEIGTGGSLKAEGANEIIQFTGVDSNNWKGIVFESTANFATSSLFNCIIKGGGEDELFPANVVLKNAYPKISNCQIKDCLGYGVYHEGAFLPGSFVNNQFSNNELGAISISANAVSSLNPQNFGTDETNFILVRGGYQEGSIVIDGSWKNFNVPYKLNNTVQIISSTLTIEPAVKIIMCEQSGFEILSQAGLIADGSFGLITIEGEKQFPGSWKNIFFSQNANLQNCQLISCQIKYGGGNVNQPGMIYCDQTNPVIRNCFIESSGTWGIYINGNLGIMDLNSNTFYNNINGNFYSSP